MQNKTSKRHPAARVAGSAWIRTFTVLTVLAAIMSGCNTQDPARVKEEMRALIVAHNYPGARSVKAKPQGIGTSPEEKAKEEVIRDEVNPKETAFLSSKLTAEVEKRIGAGQFDEARDLVWAPSYDLANQDLVPEVARPVAECKTQLLHERINRTQFIQTTNNMHKAVMAALAQNDFITARKDIAAVKPVRVYSTTTANALANVHKALANAKVPANDAEKVVADLKPVLDKIFADSACKTKTMQPGETFKPDEGKFNDALSALRKSLVDQGLDETTADKVKNAVDQVASVGFKKLWRPQEAYDVAPPEAIGTSKLNELLEKAKKEQLDEFVVPAQIAYRAKALRDKIIPLVKAGDLDKARATIHAFGVTGHPEVDDPVFAVKLGLLNARVNIAEWEARREALVKTVTAALTKCDLDAASAAIAADMPVPAYGAPVDKALHVAAVKTAKLGRDEGEAGKVVAEAQVTLYETIAPRPDAAREERIMDAYTNEVARIVVEKFGEVPEVDWSAVSNALANAAAWLVADDMSLEDAHTFVKEVMAGFQTLPEMTADTEPTALTTEKLNAMLSDLKADLSAKVSGAISLKMAAAALVAEAASLPPDELARRLEQLKDEAAEKVSLDFAKTFFEETSSAAQRNVAEAKKAAAETAAEAQRNVAKAEKAAAEAAAEAERLRNLALEMAERAAAAVDFDARINGFIEAVSDRTEPDINRILGDGARILRLRRAGVRTTKGEATSLLAAAVYMGFDDVMNLAVTLGADVNGFAAKDELKRPILLLAMQYGFRGRANDVLAKADRFALDIRGDGALHYAVKGGNGTALVDLLREGIDAKRPGANGMTPIVLAADIGYAGLVQALVPFSNLEKADDKGFTALLRAAQNGRLDIVRNLAAAGAKMDATNGENDGVLELAAMANAPELLNWLLDEKKITPTARVISQLVEAGNVPTLQQMVAHGAKLMDEHLAAAVARGDFPMVRYLVNQGMDVNAPVVKKAGLPKEASVEAIRVFLYEQGQRP